MSVRRLSSKEEKKRVVPAIFIPDSAYGSLIGFDNHTNVFHRAKRGLTEEVVKGLSVYLNSTFTDQWLRIFSGHTQVNAGDLRALRYPDIKTLQCWGNMVDKTILTQHEIDQLVGEKKLLTTP